MLRWSLIYAAPSALVLAAWVIFFLRQRKQMRTITPWVALVATTLPGIAGFWALNHVHEMAERAANDFRFEDSAVFFSVLGLVASVAWLRRSRRFSSWATLAASAIFCVLWITVIRLSS